MGEYKVIFRADIENPDSQNGITWEQGCPLMFEAIQISRDIETGKAFLQTKVRNLSGVTINSFKAKLQCRYCDESVDEFEIEPLDADIAPCGIYTLSPILLSKSDAVSALANILVVHWGTKEWVSSSSSKSLPARKPIALSDDALSERIVQLREHGIQRADETAQYETMDHREWTQCCCGQVNVGLSKCFSCGLSFDDPVARGDEGYYLDSAAVRRDNKERIEQQKLRRYESLKKKVPIISIVIALLLALIIAYGCGYLGGQPQADRLERDHTAQVVKSSKDSITPYLNLLGEEVSSYKKDETKLAISKELYKGITSVTLMGIDGEVSFDSNDDRVTTVEWKSKDFYTSEERERFIESLNSYFGSTYSYEQDKMEDYEWYTYTYTWRDEEANAVAILDYSYIPKADKPDSTQLIVVEWQSEDASWFDDSVYVTRK